VPVPVPVAVPAPRPTAGLAQWSALAETARVQPPAPSVALDRVRGDLGDCRRCSLCKERHTIVFGVGDPDADLVVIGEAPGYHEDQQGEPFVGPAGQMLDRMLENVLGLTRAQVYITNVVKCRPPKNRDPRPDEVESCRPFLEAQLRAIRPKVVLVLGSVAYRTMFATDQGVTRHRGTWKVYPLGDTAEPDRAVPVLPTFHPAYLLRKPEDKKLAFEDLKLIRARYDQLGGRR
jgi:DNA polymerase